MESRLTYLSPQELYEYLQSLDDVDKSIRLVGNRLLLPSLSGVYKLLHTSRETVWDGMRVQMPFCLSQRRFLRPGTRLGRSANIRVMRVVQSKGIAGVLSEFLDLDYLWQPGNEWAIHSFAAGSVDRELTRKFSFG